MKNLIRKIILRFLFPEYPNENKYFSALVELQKKGVDIRSLPLREVARRIGCEGKPQIVKHHLQVLFKK